MDLHEDKKVAVTAQAVDEFGVPTTFDGPIAYTVDQDPAAPVVNLTDNGDGTAEVAAVGGGALGVATLTMTATPAAGGAAISKVESINVIAGAAEGFSLGFGPEEEVTPDV